jgi:hypothetical protein
MEFYSVDYPGLEMKHLLDGYKPSAADSRWLGSLRDEKGWLVVTCDRGCDNSKEKLPIICKEFGITHIAFTQGLLRQGFTAQKNALVGVWPELFLLYRIPPGTQVKLGAHQGRGGVEKFALRIANGKSFRTLLPADDITPGDI